MNRILKRLGLIFLIFFAVTLQANEPDSFEPFRVQHASWVFSGIIHNENGEQYGYFFRLKRDEQHFQAISAVIDAQSKKMLLYDKSEAKITMPAGQSFQIGHAFLSFNPINDSWIFGLKKKDKSGFNFKVDMLRSFTKDPATKTLRHGIKLIVSKTNRLNGHLRLAESAKEEFVTADKSWFRQVWLTEKQEQSHGYSGILCQFNDGSGFYSISMPENDTQTGAVAGFCDKEGKPKSISQFVNFIKDKARQDIWHIHIPSPRMHLTLMSEMPEIRMQAGFITKGKKSGFCFLNEAELGG